MRRTTCSDARTELLRGVDRVSGNVARHLEGCDECASYAARFVVVREGLRDHRALVTPDAGFAARVGTALSAAAAATAIRNDVMSWAALRLLPATLVLALILGGWCWIGTSSPAHLTASASSDDVLVWVLDDGS